MSAAPGRLRLRRVAFARLARIREGREFRGIYDPPGFAVPGRLERWLKKRGVSLWGGGKKPSPGPPPPPADVEHPAEPEQAHPAAPVTPSSPDAEAPEPAEHGHLERFTDEEHALYFGAPEETPIARRDAAILGLSRQAEALGISVVNLLSGLILAEHEVRRVERNGKTLDWGRFSRTTATAQRLRRERSDIEKEARAVTEALYISLAESPEERQREEQEYRAARGAQNEKRRERLEEEARALGGEWKALYVLPEIIRDAPHALECWRVRYALAWLRAQRLLYAEDDLPPELGKLLDLIGQKVAHPKRYKWRPSERETLIVNVWGMRAHFSPDARQKKAEALGLEGWESLKSMALRYLASERAKELSRRRRPKPPAR